MKVFKFVCAATLAFAPTFCLAQDVAFNASTDTLVNAPETAASSTPAPAAAATASGDSGPTAESKLGRWVDLKELSFSARYRSEVAPDDYTFFANGQQRSVIDGRLKLDAAARYTLDFKVSSGRSFNWAYSDVISPDFESRLVAPADFAAIPVPVVEKLLELFGLGYVEPIVPSRGWEMTPRQLYISATPLNWVTAQYGSLGIERGKGSEITTYDDDGYLTGERILLHDPKHLYFDEVAVTYAFEGDIFTPDFIDRTQHLKKSNYHQFLFSKDFSKRIGASTDYTFDKKTHTIREAAYIRVPETKVLDAVRAEVYERVNTVEVGPFYFNSGSGFGLTAEKTLFKRVKLDGGYEQVDTNYGATVDNVLIAYSGFSMNGDSYSTGKHIFTHANVKLTPYTSLSGFYIHETTPPPSGTSAFVKQGFNGGLNIDVKSLLTKAHVL
jgi:hypothetical protein